VEALEEQGIQVEQYYAELGHGQQELSVAPRPALRAADTQILVRETIRGVAARSGLVASLAPKPWPDQAGNGAHIHFSMWDGDGRRNLFHDPAGRYGLSRTAEQFTAGVLEHAGAITAVVCPTVNSYKRMLPRGLMNEISWAPVYRAYGHNNRTLMCRLPMNRRCLELRIADSACNFYLGAAITLAAGLEGVQRRLKPGDPLNVDTYSVSEASLTSAGVRRVPATLGEAVAEFEADPLARRVFGEELHATYVRVRRAEWQEYNTVVGEWERERYLHLW
jgi:glutamine synthetase